jgi:hypothetical protein
MAHHVPESSPSADEAVAPSVVPQGLPLEVAESTFRLLTSGPSPLALDGRLVGHGLPRRLIPLHELSAVLMHPATSFAARDAAWRLLVTRARTEGSAWVVGAVGVALPGLRSAAGRLSRAHGAADVQADLLTGFLAALATLDVEEGRICPRLCNAAYVAARAGARAADPARTRTCTWQTGRALMPDNHPDFLLDRAVRLGIITVDEADLIGVTRLEGQSLTAYAADRRISRWVLYKHRRAAETRLVQALQAGALTDPVTETVVEATLTTDLDRPERPPSPS